MPRISERVGGISESATLAMDRRAKELRQRGESVISFAAGEPDFPTPAAVVEVAVAACSDPRMHHYTPAAGLPELRQAVADSVNRLTGESLAAANVLVTSGTKQAVAHAFATVLNPGDEVLIASPYWVTFPEAVTLAGGVPVAVPTDDSRAFRVSVDDLERHRGPRTKALLFVSPANPTGTVYPEARMREIGDWVEEHGLFVVSDEIYQNFTYGEARFRSMPQVVPAIAEQTIRLGGVSKSYAMTGWRVGWMVASPQIIAAAGNLQSHVCGNIANVSQRAAVAALQLGDSAMAPMREAFTRRRGLILNWLAQLQGFECPGPEGAFYVFPSVQGLIGRQVAGQRIESSSHLAGVLLDQARVAVVPGEAFGAPGYLRLSYALADADLDEGMARIGRVLA
ncbi:MAG: pyridoxal phosphate-dependent aminotransferase, partial [Candidatus Dormibacteria bacterium]